MQWLFVAFSLGDLMVMIDDGIGFAFACIHGVQYGAGARTNSSIPLVTTVTEHYGTARIVS